ncbi:MAG: DNA mismatch repair endonuclease MutL [Lachnoclostridium sp.]|nr:DNA mismatch repair endonuclease MutL [Lachnoclostridium sp.]
MSDVIRLLPDSVANQIAAGEVIQRPASVIKELVENAIDAGADNITIVLKDAGRTLIQVIDNGSGMSDTDARLAFERHATSKISKADDLFSLHTMGFRGEALASIAAISQVDLRTMLHGASVGTRLIINGSKVESQKPEASIPGTNLMVKNIFFNVPARRKFLKKDSVELSNIMREFERLALVNINVDFTLIHNDVTLHALRKASMKQRIVDLFGKNLDRQLIPVETDTSIVRLSGFISLPENARKRNALQYFMVNGRNMRHPYFHKALMQCYDKLISPDEQPNYFINLQVDPETIDVNIHPTKNEIKFENEQAIWQILTAAIRDSLGRFNAAPALDFDMVDAPDIPVFDPDADLKLEEELDPAYNPFAPDKSSDTVRSQIPSGGGGTTFRSRVNTTSVTDWEKLYDDFEKKKNSDTETIIGSSINDVDSDSMPAVPQLVPEITAPSTMQLKNSYILTPSRRGLLIIDQHRAHVRILFEKYQSMVDEKSFVAQQSMFPEVLELSPAESVILESITSYLEQLGFNLSPLGGNSWSILSIPSVINNVTPSELISGIIATVEQTGEDISASLSRKVALSFARSNAIKRGQQLSSAEMETLISDLFKLSTPALTPDGKTVFSVITLDDISSMF